jgi:hypothetical protein
MVTEKQLLDGYLGVSSGGMVVSSVDDGLFYWNYRSGNDGYGYNYVTTRDKASQITLEYHRYGVINMDNTLSDHPSIVKISAAKDDWFEKLYS